MLGIPLIVAQCTGALDDCDLPRTLPWYFGLAIAAAWLATVVGAVLLLRRRLLARRAERRDRNRHKAIEAHKGSDVEIW
ncbi:MAG TPA: hypothetical protein VM345_13105 [Acidimicrobiales bacterium]|nr:hypothetical protein [Acidimicrobiales bacterium]